MMPKELLDPQMSDAISDLRTREEPFAMATIIRTAGATAAKPGAKALLRADGTILHGWLGGGCTKSAVAKAALKSIEEGTPQLISIAPEDVLTEKGVSAGEEVEGIRMARNGCPSEGTIDVFIEPCLPRPQLVVFGHSPVGLALSEMAMSFDWDVLHLTSDDKLDEGLPARRRAIVVATQGQGDLAALKQALAGPADYRAFVGSRRKFEVLAAKLVADEISKSLIETMQAPAGIDISAVTPEEIALSIFAQLTLVRRRAQKGVITDG